MTTTARHEMNCTCTQCGAPYTVTITPRGGRRPDVCSKECARARETARHRARHSGAPVDRAEYAGTAKELEKRREEIARSPDLLAALRRCRAAMYQPRQMSDRLEEMRRDGLRETQRGTR